jgi:hypothetical protein
MEVYEKRRRVICEDAVAWLRSSEDPLEGSIFCGIPDIADVYNFIPSNELVQRGKDYEEWFVTIIRLIFQRISSGQCVILSQTDGKIIDHDGKMICWLDKPIFVIALQTNFLVISCGIKLPSITIP